MSQPFVGEIRMFGGTFAPAGWAFCDGSLQPISENDTLFNLIGTTYGGDGQETFALPDLRGRLPMHQGQGAGLSNRLIGESSGAENTTLAVQHIPAHNHSLMGSTDQGTASAPQGAAPASLPAAGTASAYGTKNPQGTLDPSSLTSAGGSQPHENMQPFTVVSFIISLFGIFPSQS